MNRYTSTCILYIPTYYVPEDFQSKDMTRLKLASSAKYFKPLAFPTSIIIHNLTHKVNNLNLNANTENPWKREVPSHTTSQGQQQPASWGAGRRSREKEEVLPLGLLVYAAGTASSSAEEDEESFVAKAQRRHWESLLLLRHLLLLSLPLFASCG